MKISLNHPNEIHDLFVSLSCQEIEIERASKAWMNGKGISLAFIRIYCVCVCVCMSFLNFILAKCQSITFCFHSINSTLIYGNTMWWAQNCMVHESSSTYRYSSLSISLSLSHHCCRLSCRHIHFRMVQHNYYINSTISSNNNNNCSMKF